MWCSISAELGLWKLLDPILFRKISINQLRLRYIHQRLWLEMFLLLYLPHLFFWALCSIYGIHKWERDSIKIWLLMLVSHLVISLQHHIRGCSSLIVLRRLVLTHIVIRKTSAGVRPSHVDATRIISLPVCSCPAFLNGWHRTLHTSCIEGLSPSSFQAVSRFIPE